MKYEKRLTVYVLRVFDHADLFRGYLLFGVSLVIEIPRTYHTLDGVTQERVSTASPKKLLHLGLFLSFSKHTQKLVFYFGGVPIEL